MARPWTTSWRPGLLVCRIYSSTADSSFSLLYSSPCLPSVFPQVVEGMQLDRGCPQRRLVRLPASYRQLSSFWRYISPYFITNVKASTERKCRPRCRLACLKCRRRRWNWRRGAVCGAAALSARISFSLVPESAHLDLRQEDFLSPGFPKLVDLVGGSFISLCNF